MRKEFGEMIKNERLRQELTQADIVDSSGDLLSLSTLRAIESGKQRVYLDQALRIMSVLGFDGDEVARYLRSFL